MDSKDVQDEAPPPERDEQEFLTPEERSEFVDFLNDRTPGQAACPICKEQQWEVANLRVTLMPSPTSDKGYPLVPVICSNCGFTALFNTLAMKKPRYAESGTSDPEEEVGATEDTSDV